MKLVPLHELLSLARKLAGQAVILGLVAGVYGSAQAQDLSQEQQQERPGVASESEKDSEEPRASKEQVRERDLFVNPEAGFRLTRAGGWLWGVPSQGAVALFRAAGEPQAQIEIRVSENIDGEQRSAYVSAFDNRLLRVGFVQVETRNAVNYGGRIGQEYEYSVLSDGRDFRLIVWIYFREDEAWIASGFFPLAKREAHYRGFQQMLRSLEFTD